MPYVETMTLDEKLAISYEAAELRKAGDRWVSPYNSGDTITFIDRNTMIMTNDGRKTQARYSVNGSRVIIGNNIISYERRGDDFYLIGNIAYTNE